MTSIGCDVGAARSSLGRGWRAAGIAAVCVGLLGPVGCFSSTGGFETTGYTSSYGYEIPYERGTQRLLPVHWNIDNFHLSAGQWVRKDRDRYITIYDFDDDGHGRGETFRGFTYALRYEHSVHAGVIWLREIPIAHKLRAKDLRVLLHSYLDEIAGATYESVKLGSETSRDAKVVVEHRQAPIMIEEGPATVGGQPAYAATFDLVNVDEIRVDPHARALRIQLVVMRAPRDDSTSGQQLHGSYPVLLLAGYSNMPTDFANSVGDFHGLLRKMTFAGRSGLTLDLAPAAPAPAPAAPPAPAPPPAP